MDRIEIARRFTFYPPATKERHEAHVRIRESCRELAVVLDAQIPDGREKAVALTKIEEVMFWANAALARDGSTAPEQPVSRAVGGADGGNTFGSSCASGGGSNGGVGGTTTTAMTAGSLGLCGPPD